MLLTIVHIVAIIYAIDYGVSLLTGDAFQRPATAAVIAAVAAAKFSRQRKDNNHKE